MPAVLWIRDGNTEGKFMSKLQYNPTKQATNRQGWKSIVKK